MTKKNKLFLALTLLFLVFTFSAPQIHAKGNEYKSVVKHLKTKYKAKKVKVPFMWLARFAVKVVRPAGVKSFSMTIFENLNFSRDTLDAEMQAVMRNSLSAEWSPIFRVRSREGQQAYMYIREAGSNVRIMLVTIDNDQAAVIRATFDPDKLIEFIDNPKILGVSLDDDKKDDKPKTEKLEEQ